jgi:hypothetical protein
MFLQAARIGLTADDAPWFVRVQAAIVLLKTVFFVGMLTRHDSTPI